MQTEVVAKDYDKLVDDSFQELMDLCGPKLTDQAKDMVRKAYEFARECHKGTIRKSGEPYIIHPIEVAKIVCSEIGLGSKGIISALLHDVVEDTHATVEDIKNMFGERIAQIVDGLTKMNIVFDQETSMQAENFRKLLLTMSDDVRVILVKIADRLHNMRTLQALPPNKQLKIAGETLFLFAPLAYRLGLYLIKTELEDLSFKYQHPELYQDIADKIQLRAQHSEKLVDSFSEPIVQELKRQNYEFEIKSRPKSIYSIWNKMQRKNIPFEEIYDIFAFRVVFEAKEDKPEKTQCWDIYSFITDVYKPKPDRIRDWIAVPKVNGYEALHATVMGPGGNWVEVQIRSRRMDEIAEKGFAAHGKYKGIQSEQSELDKWLKKIQETLENKDSDALEFLDDFKMNLYTSEIMVFTPKGDVKSLPKNATVLDFAFDIHSDLGLHCIGAKVNHKLVPLTHTLNSGDQVEVLTSDKQKPQQEWLDIVKTARAKQKLKWVFKRNRRQVAEKGRKILEEQLKQLKLTINSRIIGKLLSHFDLQFKEDLYFQLGKGLINLKDLGKILKKRSENKFMRYWKLQFSKGNEDNKEQAAQIKEKKILVLKESNAESDYKMARCCNPIPGDNVIGFENTDGQVIIHSRKCPNAIKLMSQRGNKILSAVWTKYRIMSFLSAIKIYGIDKIGIAHKITHIISQELSVNMRSIKIESHDGIFEGEIYLYIHNVGDLNNIIYQLSKIKGVDSVTRLENLEIN